LNYKIIIFKNYCLKNRGVGFAAAAATMVKTIAKASGGCGCD
jgi:hypothetical protein